MKWIEYSIIPMDNCRYQFSFNYDWHPDQQGVNTCQFYSEITSFVKSLFQSFSESEVSHLHKTSIEMDQKGLFKLCNHCQFLKCIARLFGNWQSWPLFRPAKCKPQLDCSITRWHSLEVRPSPRSNLRHLRVLNRHNQRQCFQFTRMESWPSLHRVGVQSSYPITHHQQCQSAHRFLSTSQRTLISWNVHVKCLNVKR